LEGFGKSLLSLCENEKKSKKKNNEVDYFISNGFKVFNSMVSMLHKNY
jgi:hypothetical protein